MNEEDVKLLIVDDDSVDAECLLRYMKKRGLKYETETLSDGGKALEFLRSRVDPEALRRVIVLLDINMPGINGHEFLDEVRNDPALRSIIVFVFTSSAHERDITKAYENNVAGYFVKSNLDGLLDTIVPFAQNVEFPVQMVRVEKKEDAASQ